MNEENIEKIVEKKVAEKLNQKTEENGKNKTEEVSRRSFLKGLGALGVGALAMSSPVASQMKITSRGIYKNGETTLLGTDSSFSKMRNNLNMNSYSIENTSSFNTADLANASADTVLVAQGDGSLSMKEMEEILYSTGHTQWASELNSDEINRWKLESGEIFKLKRLEVSLQGGGANSDFTVEVYDETSGTVLNSATAGNVDTSNVESGEGNSITVRVVNDTGSDIIGSITISALVKEA